MEDLKSLAKLVKLCRKLGVKSYKSETVELVLTDEVSEAPIISKRKQSKLTDNDEELKSDMPSENQLLFWSSSSEIESPSGEI